MARAMLREMSTSLNQQPSAPPEVMPLINALKTTSEMLVAPLTLMILLPLYDIIKNLPRYCPALNSQYGL